MFEQVLSTADSDVAIACVVALLVMYVISKVSDRIKSIEIGNNGLKIQCVNYPDLRFA